MGESAGSAEEVVRVKLVLSNTTDELAKNMADALSQAATTAGKTTAGKGGSGWQGMFSMKANADALGTAFKSMGTMGMHALSGIGVAAGIASGIGIAAITASLFAANTRAEKLKETTLAMMSYSGKKNTTFGDAKVMADAYDAQFRRVAISSGASRDAVQAAFMTVADGLRGTYRARLTRAQSEAITESMAQAAKVVPGGLARLTTEYEQMKTGQFSSGGALIGMISATKVLKGTTVEVARQMATMTDVNRMTIAEEALKRMAKQAKNIPLGFEGLKTSLTEMYDLAAVSLGEPLVNELLPVLNTVKDWFASNATSIELVARGIGKQLGGFVNGVGSIVSSFYKVFSNDSGKLGQYIQTAFSYAKDAFAWIVDNAEPLAKTFRDVFDVIIGALEKAATALGLTAAAKAIMGEHKDTPEERSMKVYAAAELQRGQRGGAIEASSNSDKYKIADAQDRGEVDKARTNIAQARFAMQDLAAGGADGAAATEKIVGMYQSAVDSHDAGLQAWLQAQFSGNQTLQQALIDQGANVRGGLELFAKDVGDVNFLDNLRKATRADGGTKALAPQVNFNGNTFNIKQDFRDQDPDRVMFAFERDLTRAASNRTQGKLGMSGLAFGV